MLSARLPASLPSSESAFSFVRVRSSGRPIRRCGPSRQQVGPVLLESWWRGRARCCRLVLVVLPGPGPACQWLASAAASSDSSSCRLSFRFASKSFSRCRPVGPNRRTNCDGAARWAAPMTALLGPLAGCTRLIIYSNILSALVHQLVKTISSVISCCQSCLP